jgi:hypothetical protein
VCSRKLNHRQEHESLCRIASLCEGLCLLDVIAREEKDKHATLGQFVNLITQIPHRQ